MTVQTPDTQPSERPRGIVPAARTMLVCALALAAAIGGWLWITAAPSHEVTDDAYVAADTTSVAPKVRGLVSAILARDNQTVRAGQVIVRIDPEEFDARVAQADAAVTDAQAGAAAARAALVSLDAARRLAAAQVVAARTAIRSADAQAARARADNGRYAQLVTSGAVSRRDADGYAAAAVTADQEAARARALLAVSDKAAGVTDARRGELLAALRTAEAKVGQARATARLAEQDRRHADIVAAIDGTVGNRQVHVGDYVQPGTRLLSLVPLHALYVTANFKETQTARIRPGQRAEIEVDALPGHPLHGTVDSLAPGSGSTFSLLPFEPGTGNFTKIVQRIGVKIRLDPGQPELAGLRPGLSVAAQIHLDSIR